MVRPVTGMSGHIVLKQSEFAALLNEKYEQGFAAGYEKAKSEIEKAEKETEEVSEENKTVRTKTKGRFKTEKGEKEFRSTIAEACDDGADDQ